MIVKPSITWISRNDDSLFINNTKVVLKAMTDNVAIYPTPAPSLAEVQTALDNFSDAVVVSADGGRSATAAKKNLRLVLANLLRQLASYVLVACKGIMANLLLSGFPTQKPVHQPVGPMPAPGGVTLGLGFHSGELDAGCNPVFGAATYNWRLTDITTGLVAQTGQSTGSEYTFTALTPGKTFRAEVNVMGAAGPSDWSASANQMVV
jgi:hypothetical protein